jgi:multiple sugar transport system permease protein
VVEVLHKGKFRWLGYAFVLPAVMYMLVMVGYPIIYNLQISMQQIDVTNLAAGTHKFVGLANYVEVFKKDVFWISLRNTLTYTVISILFQFAIGFALALFFNLKFKLAPYLRSLMLVTWLTPIVVTALLYKFMFSSSVGLINFVLFSLGLIDKPVEWLTDPNLAMPAIITANVWIGIPFNMILLATGLNNLPHDVYESSSIDGASRWERFIYITLPLLRPVMMIVMILGFIYTFKVFDLIYVMTGGGPVNATEVLSTLAYRYSFDQFQFSIGATVSNLLFFVLLIVSLIYLRMIRNDEVM